MKVRTINRFLLLTILIAVNQRALTQPKVLWDSAFGNVGMFNYGVSQITNDDGIVYKAFKIEGIGTNNPWIWKFDAAGNYQWDKTYGAGYEGEANSIKQTPDNGYILTGSARISDLIYNLWILKLNENGDSIWSRKLESNVSTTGNDIFTNSDGTCLIVGQIEDTNQHRSNLLVIKINSQGDTLWSKKYENSLSYTCKSLIKCVQGGYAAIAVIDSTGETSFDYQIIRFGENGDTLWTKKQMADCLISSISQTSNNGFIITGSQFNGLDWDMLLLKTNSNGDKEWAKTFGGNSWELGYSVKQTNDDGYIIAGTSSSFGLFSNLDAWLIKTDKFGNTIWSDTFGGFEENERALQVFVTSDNGYYITGNVKHLFWVARLDIDSLNGLPTNIIGSTVPNSQLWQNYPNPFTTKTTIDYEIRNTSKVIISVFNMSGDEIIRLTDNFMTAGNYSVSWNGKDMHGNKVSSGVYYYQMLTVDSQAHKTNRFWNKMIFSNDRN
jgi:hypothetical protein